MAEWKKVIVSGSNAELGTLNVSNGITGSLQGTASYASFSNITYVTSSNEVLNQIEVADFDANVAVTFLDGKLKFIFGTPTAPTAPVLSFNSTFATDRFNQVTDNYDVTGSINVGAYSLTSAKLFTGSVLIDSTTTGTSLRSNFSTIGTQQYRLEVTASSPLDGTLDYKSTLLTGTLAKSNPGAPTISPTPLVQLSAASSQIEQGATGSITFTSASGASNGWVANYTSTNVESPIFVTGSATGSASIAITATSFYSSSGAGGSDNSPALTTTSTATTTYTKIRSVRYGASAATSFTQAELENLALWDTTLGGSIGTIIKGQVSPRPITIPTPVTLYDFTVTTSAQYIYIVVDSSYTLTGILNVGNSLADDKNVFTETTVGNYKVWRSNNPSATTITYRLTI